jgi:exodeoxyribonuclease VII small subunit
VTTKPFEFEKSLKELEDITTWFESTDVDLDAGLAKFERGMELATELKAHLASVENRVEKIRQRFSGAAPGTSSAPTGNPDEPPVPAYEPGESDQTDLFGA